MNSDKFIPTELSDSAAYNLRLYRLEREAEIAAFHRGEVRREQAIVLVVIQAGLALSGLVYAGIWFGLLPGEIFEAGKAVSGFGIAAIAAVMLASAILGLGRLLKSRQSENKSLHLPELAE
jgi:hypothetical protein